MTDLKDLKVALIHYWLVGMRGGEKVLEQLCRIFPQADIYTHVCNRKKLSEKINQHQIYTSFVSRLPFASRLYKLYLPFMNPALEELDLRGYDLIISSESGPAKGIRKPLNSLHVCYCHSPMRYLWDFYNDYQNNASFPVRFFMRKMSAKLRLLDLASSFRVDSFIANSQYVAKRVHSIYRRKAEVIHPPLDFERFSLSREKGKYYLFAGQLVDYKRVDLAIAAFKDSQRQLIIAGRGKLPVKKLPSNIEFVEAPSDEKMLSLLQGCRALVFPGIEDFGIMPLEAMACGKPVIAYQEGGALETVINKKSGLFFSPQNAEALKEALSQFEETEQDFNPEFIREHARAFNQQEFQKKMISFLQEKYQEFKGGRFLV